MQEAAAFHRVRNKSFHWTAEVGQWNRPRSTSLYKLNEHNWKNLEILLKYKWKGQ